MSKIIRDIVQEQTFPDTVEREALNVLAKEVDALYADIESAFQVRFSIMESIKGQYATKFATTSEKPFENTERLYRRVTADDFMSQVSPPEKPPKATDSLAPYIQDITKLRSEGYTWKQVCEFLRQNGIEMHVNPVAMYFNKWNKQVLRIADERRLPFDVKVPNATTR